MPPAFLRRLRRRRLLLRHSPHIVFLRLHGASENRADHSPRTPADDQARAVLDERPHLDAVAYAATVDLRPRPHDLPRAAPASARGPHMDTFMLDGHVKAGRVDRARSLFDGMTVKSVAAWTCVLSGYCRAGRVEEGRALFDAMPARNVVSWTTMLQGYARSGMLREARELFDRMPERNVVTWTVMVKAYADHGHFQEAMELFDRMPQRNPYSWTAMISGFLRAGKVDEAVRLFERMPDRNVVSWTTMVTGLAQSGRVSMAREFFDRMPKDKDIVAWNAMVTAYANDGQMNEAQRLFDSMPAKNLVSWNALIHGYAKGDRKDEVIGLFLLMLRSAVSPDITTLISVLVTSNSIVEVGQIHGFATTRAREVGEALAKSDGSFGSDSEGYYKVLTNVFASGGMWEEMAGVWKAMKGSNVRKTPGVSQIVVDVTTHTFFSRDQMHPQCAEIYEMLDDTLVPQMMKTDLPTETV
ncbi:hypothetical protein ZWY2020_019397 [Hordeum vulgare]|nr:hypothetical protein ZWY2020_019397 [Hordeum vulgare]